MRLSILLVADKLQKNNEQKKVLVAGCLSQRYKDELKQEIPEIDGIFGTEDYKNILSGMNYNYQ